MNNKIIKVMISVIPIISIFMFGYFWFYKFNFHALYGDDLSRWDYFNNISSIKTVLKNAFFHLSLEKYRPVAELLYYLSYILTDYKYHLFVFLNISLICIIALKLYVLLNRLVSCNRLISFSVSILFISSYLSFYNAYQMHGIFESFCMLMLLFVVEYSLGILNEKNITNYFLVIFFLFVVALTHERYLILILGVIATVILSKYSIRSKILMSMASFAPFLFIYFIIAIVFKRDFFLGTSREHMSLNISGVSAYMGKGLSAVIGLPIMNKTFLGVDIRELSIVSFIPPTLLLIYCAYIIGVMFCRKNESSEKRNVVAITAIFYILVLFVSSITVRQEIRWLYPPYLLLMLIIGVLFDYISKINRKAIYLAIIIIVLCFGRDLYYKKAMQNDDFIYYRRQVLMDSLYDLTIKKYGANISNYNIYVKKFNDDYWWMIRGELFFCPYIGRVKTNVIMYDNNEKLSALVNKKTKNIIIEINKNNSAFNDITSSVLSGF